MLPGAYSEKAIEFFKEYHRNDSIRNDAEKGLTIIIEYEHEIIATGTLLANEIKRVFVLHAWQNQGLGKVIMNSLEQKALGTGINSVELHSSVISRDFYTCLGYKTRKDGYIDLGSGGKLNYSEMVKGLKG